MFALFTQHIYYTVRRIIALRDPLEVPRSLTRVIAHVNPADFQTPHGVVPREVQYSMIL